MKAKKVRKILIIISAIILLFGIIAGNEVRTELRPANWEVTGAIVDGSDFTAIADGVHRAGTALIGFIIFLYFLMVVAGIWGVYGIIMLIIIIVKKIRGKNGKEK